MRHEKLAIYTAITGGKNRLKEPLDPDPQVDYLCFTDDPGSKSKVWQVSLFPSEVVGMFTDEAGVVDKVRLAKFPKLQPHKFPGLGEANILLWADGSIQIKTAKISDFMKSRLGRNKFVAFRHELTTIGDLLEDCVSHNKDDQKMMTAQVNGYLQQGLPQDIPLINGSYLLSRPLDDEVVAMNTAWWAQVLEFSKRDELSFPFVAWLLNFNYALFPELNRFYCSEIEYFRHEG